MKKYIIGGSALLSLVMLYAFSKAPEIKNLPNSVQFIKPVAVLITNDDSIKMVAIQYKDVPGGKVLFELPVENPRSAIWITPDQDVVYAKGKEVLRYVQGKRITETIWRAEEEVVTITLLPETENLLILTEKNALELTWIGEVLWKQPI